MLFKLCACLFIYSTAYIQSTNAHSHLTEPITRSNQFERTTGCKTSLGCTVCDAPAAQAGIKVPFVKVKRGDKIDLAWPRNNHAGGFIRIAWAPTEESDSAAAFDKNVQLWTCHEMTCQADNFATDPFGGDTGGQTGKQCQSSVTVPPQLPDGKFTLQWVWIGGQSALEDYFSCVDYIIEGGVPQTNDQIVPEGRFGDVHFPGQDKCLYFNTNEIGVCVVEPCANAKTPGKQEGLPASFTISGNVTVQPNLPVSSNIANSSASIPVAASATSISPIISQFVSQSVKTVSISPSPSVIALAQNASSPLKVVQVSTKARQSVEPSPLPSTAAETFDEVELQLASDSFIAQYLMTFKDETSRTFGGVIRVQTLEKSLPGWSVSFKFLGNRTVTQVFGAQQELSDDGTNTISSNSTISANQSVTVGILGSF